MFENAIRLWKNRKEYKSSTLQGRLILFFALVVCSVLLLFTLMLMLFGITGSGRAAAYRYFESELSYISTAIEKDFGHISATGIQLGEQLSNEGDNFFRKNSITASELSDNPAIAEAFLAEGLDKLLSVAEHNACGGVFVVLDVNASGDMSSGKRTGFFIKKTQPVSSATLTAKPYCLRGSATLARENGIELLGQWQMQYDESELDFFYSVMDTAKANPDLPLSRLYYWIDRVCLNGNSEKGLLLCVPLRCEDGTVFGICGIEVSDRMFKMLYSPNESEYQGVFAIVAPRSQKVLYANRGLIAGNTYLTDKQMTGELAFYKEQSGFLFFIGEEQTYGGLNENVRFYSAGSPYEDEQWAVVTLMPKTLLDETIKGQETLLFVILAVLMAVSLAASVFVSKRYLHPIKKGLSSLRENGYDTDMPESGIVEIDSLFEDLALNIRAHKEEMERLSLEKQDAEARIAEAKTQIERLTNKRKREIDPNEYARFLESLNTLTATERKIFEMYLEGKTPDEVLEALQIKDNTLKYHNRNIYGKLGVASRKQLLTYAAIMQQGEEITE